MRKRVKCALVFIASFAAGPWQTNCYIVAPADGGECVIIDPGVGAEEGIAGLVTEHKLNPVGVVATHGHIDHVYAAEHVSREFGVPVWVHESDRHLLTDPLAGIGQEAKPLLLQLTGSTTMTEPADVRALIDGETLSLAGIEFALSVAPGHTPGSVLLEMPYRVGPNPQIDRIVFSGDVVFAGSIGRTDFPGGSMEQMRESLRTKVLPLPDTTALLPGHGPQTSMARERITNPYLQGDLL